MPNIYQIELNLKGDLNAKLDDAIKKAQNLKSITNNIGGRGGSFNNPAGGRRYNPYPHIPEERMNLWRRMNYAAYRSPFANNRHLLRNIDRYYQARQRFQNNFIANSFTYSGWQRNLGNFANLIGSVGKAALQAIPALKSVIGTLGGIVGLKAVSIAGGGLLYRWGRNNLMSEQTSQAISNVSQYNMARLAQGSGYNEMFRNATDIVTQTGGSRAGLVSLMNTMTGLTVGDTKLSSRDAQWFGQLAAKISAVSGRDLQIVGLNLQQLLTTWQGIDMKELFKSVPLIEKYVFDLRAQSKNKGEDIYSFIRENPQALIKAFEKFIGQFELPRAGVLKGRVQLSEENLEADKLEYLEDFYEDIANTSIHINESLSKLYKIFGEGYDGSIFQKAISAFDSFISGIINVGSKIINWINEHPTISSFIGGFGSGALLGSSAGPIGSVVSGLVSGTTASLWSQVPEYNLTKEQAINRLKGTILRTNYLYREPSDDKLYKFGYLTSAVKDIKLSADDIETLFNNLNNLGTKEAKDLIKRLRYYTPDLTALSRAFELTSKEFIPAPTVSPVKDETGRMQDLSKGSKSLIINFNKSIVDMDNHINTTDPSTIMREIEDYVTQAIARGLNIAFNQATPLT